MHTTLRWMATAMFAWLAPGAHAEVTLHDALDCGFPDGAYVHLTRAKHVSLMPVPIVHGSRTRIEGTWISEYMQRPDGTRLPIAGRIQSSGSTPQLLGLACSYVGYKHGAVLVPYAFATSGSSSASVESGVGGWSADLPSERLQDEALKSALAANGVAQGALYLLFVMPLDGNRIVSEQALHRAGGSRALPLNAVYQSHSNDGGKTWSEPVVTKDARIFEIGKTWAQQCFLGVPIRFNGEAVAGQPRCP